MIDNIRNILVGELIDEGFSPADARHEADLIIATREETCERERHDEHCADLHWN